MKNDGCFHHYRNNLLGGRPISRFFESILSLFLLLLPDPS